MKFKNYLKISEMARLADLNIRTLHYYDEIGLFSPETKANNGYRYYSLEQIVDLGIILSLKELDMPLKEIKTVLTSDVGTSRKMLEKQKAVIDQKIEKLTDIRAVIKRKLDHFDLAEHQREEVTFIDLEEEYLILSQKMNQATSQDLIESAYDYFYLKVNKKSDGVFIKPAGRYLRYIYKGDDVGLNNAYKKIRHYIRKNNLMIEGYFYERALNETVAANLKEYVTEI